MSARLEGHDLVVTHGARRALDGASIALRRGELVALVGPNGSGKSTLLRVLLGATRASSGRVLLDGEPLDRFAPRRRARLLTMVVDGSPSDFPIRVRELVALGRIPFERGLRGASREDDAAVDEAMAMADVAPFADRAIDTLSAGELQRAHLARAFAQHAPIVLLDEPTSNLDLRHQLEAMALLRSFVDRGGAAIVAMHDLTLAARACDRIVVLERGRVRAEGRPERVLDAPLLAEVFGVRARIARSTGEESIEFVLAMEPMQRGSSSKEIG